MNEEIFEQIRVFLPKYLSPGESRELFQALSSYPDIGDHYLPPGAGDEELLQGDGWKGFIVINFDTLERKAVSGVIISNSCDIDVRNPRPTSPRVLFCPIIPLARYEALLREAGVGQERIRSVLDSIRGQKVTYIFYLPSGPYGPEESIIVLDDLYSEPLPTFLNGARIRLFRLNQTAWYVLLIKLSIHFSRANEGVRRFPLKSTPPTTAD
jgi:hypothetical protein